MPLNKESVCEQRKVEQYIMDGTVVFSGLNH